MQFAGPVTQGTDPQLVVTGAISAVADDNPGDRSHHGRRLAGQLRALVRGTTRQRLDYEAMSTVVPSRSTIRQFVPLQHLSGPAGAARPSCRDLGAFSSLLVWSVAPVLGPAASVWDRGRDDRRFAREDGSVAVHWAEFIGLRSRKAPLSCFVMTFLTMIKLTSIR